MKKKNPSFFKAEWYSTVEDRIVITRSFTGRCFSCFFSFAIVTMTLWTCMYPFMIVPSLSSFHWRPRNWLLDCRSLAALTCAPFMGNRGPEVSHRSCRVTLSLSPCPSWVWSTHSKVLEALTVLKYYVKSADKCTGVTWCWWEFGDRRATDVALASWATEGLWGESWRYCARWCLLSVFLLMGWVGYCLVRKL